MKELKKKSTPIKWDTRKQAVVVTLISDQNNKQKAKTNKKSFFFKTGHFILIRRPINQEDIIILSIYTPNSGIYTLIKSILIEFKNSLTPSFL